MLQPLVPTHPRLQWALRRGEDPALLPAMPHPKANSTTNAHCIIHPRCAALQPAVEPPSVWGPRQIARRPPLPQPAPPYPNPNTAVTK